MERGQIIALATVVIPPENTPQKKQSETLIAHPRWRYIGPADTIKFEWQIGQWWLGTFDGITSRKYKTFSQAPSMEMAEFSTSLPAILLSPLSPRAEPYICEIWFKDKFSDLRVIVENCVKIVEVPVGIAFQVSIWGIPDFGSYQKWCCYYWDPGINDFVGDGKWHYSYQKIGFSNVKTGGYLAVFLLRNSTVSSQYTSPTFDAVDGGIYQYDVQLGRVSKIG